MLEQRATERAALFDSRRVSPTDDLAKCVLTWWASFCAISPGGCTVLNPDDDAHLSPLSEATGYALSQAEAAAQTAYDRFRNLTRASWAATTASVCCSCCGRDAQSRRSGCRGCRGSTVAGRAYRTTASSC